MKCDNNKDEEISLIINNVNNYRVYKVHTIKSITTILTFYIVNRCTNGAEKFTALVRFLEVG